MNIDLDIISASSLVVVPIIIAVVQAIKLTGWVPDKFAPIVSIAIGIIIGFIANHNLADISANLLSGVMYGLMASGLYSGVKTTMEAQKAKNYQSKKDNC
jgi:small basic protein